MHGARRANLASTNRLQLQKGPDVKTPGQIAYEKDVELEPRYSDGATRKSWDQLCELARFSWEKNPTVRASVLKAHSK
jgi:hypothetical protein